MATGNTLAGVSLADVYGLLLDDIRRNRAARLAAQARPDTDQSSGADERRALQELSERERRNPRDQAALLLRERLIERGLLPTDAPTPAASAAQVQVSHDRAA